LPSDLLSAVRAPEAVPATRRALRRQEELERGTVRGPRRARQGVPVRAEAPRRSLMSRLARPLFTATTMLAVAGMAFVTSVPANALLRVDDVAALHGQASAGSGQVLAMSSAGAGAIVRDNYDVRTAAQNAFAPKFSQVPSFAAGTATTVRWPFDGDVRISDGFGPRVSPCAGCSSFHLGTDFLPGYGNPVYAMADGVVTAVNNAGGLGVHVVIDHLIDGQLITTTSAHMQVGSVRVSVGQSVKAGDAIGLVGNTGDSTGPHLHFELRLNGAEPVDPNAWLQQHVR
jgi:murein DD-endopeptidase MepM/ murein hydrolase activator NlpD